MMTPFLKKYNGLAFALVGAFLLLVSGCQQKQTQTAELDIPADSVLVKTIDTQLKETDHMMVDSLEISVRNGIVLLKGTVDNLLTKKRAGDVAERVSGVLSVVNNLDVETNRSDARIQNDIATALRTDPATEEIEMHVAVNNGKVTLKGSVQNLISKINAQQNAINTVGVGKVKNKIRVERKIVVRPEVPTTDKGIKSRIAAMINRDPYIELVEVDIKVEEGNVTLDGKVDSKYEKRHIEALTQRVKGVVSIDNNISIEHQKV